MLDHALVRGVALPGLGRRDLFLAFAELLAYDEDIGGAMDRSRDGRAADAAGRRLDQRKVTARRSRLNGKRRKQGYPNL